MPRLTKANKKEETPLLLAARYGNNRVLKLLIERAKALYNEDMAKADAEDGLSRKRHGPARGCVFNHVGAVEILTTADPDNYRYPPNRPGKIPYSQLMTEDTTG